ncbi:MAG: hypothetical protein V1659_01225 [Candidatus Woesearchaeota archaeon]
MANVYRAVRQCERLLGYRGQEHPPPEDHNPLLLQGARLIAVITYNYEAETVTVERVVGESAAAQDEQEVQAIRERWRRELAPIRQAALDAERLSAEDLSITINACDDAYNSEAETVSDEQEVLPPGVDKKEVQAIRERWRRELAPIRQAALDAERLSSADLRIRINARDDD